MKRRDRKKHRENPAPQPVSTFTFTEPAGGSTPAPIASHGGRIWDERTETWVEDRPEPAPIAPQEPAVIIREPQDLDDLGALHLLMLAQGQEMAQAPINPEKVLAKILDAARNRDRAAMLMAVKDGRLVGYLCIEKCDFWYSDESMLVDWGYFILPTYRGDDIGRELLANAREIAEGAGLPLYIAINNPSRRRGTEKVATIAGFTPQGFVLKVGTGFPAPRSN